MGADDKNMHTWIHVVRANYPRFDHLFLYNFLVPSIPELRTCGFPVLEKCSLCTMYTQKLKISKIGNIQKCSNFQHIHLNFLHRILHLMKYIISKELEKSFYK